MTTTKPKAKPKTIVLFEDNPEIAQALAASVQEKLGKGLKLKIFPLVGKSPYEKGPYEDRLVSALGKPEYGDIVLLVTDRDLSTKDWGGLSEAAVTRAAEKLGLPVACYRQSKANVEDKLRRVPGNGQLELPFEREERAKRIVTLAHGFVAMEKLLRAEVETPAASKKKVTAAETAWPHQQGTPGALLAKILGQREVSSHLDLFACGDQRAVAEILKASTGPVRAADQRRLVVALGVWLADLVMEYPGVLVGETAAASYLDISKKDFKKERVRDVFSAAAYVDLPFSDSDRPMWWRHLLDDLVNAENALSGKDLCAKLGVKKIEHCACSVDANLHAGFYCMATEEPLSDEKSSGRVSWFPAGADLARLSARTHRALAPWIGS